MLAAVRTVCVGDTQGEIGSHATADWGTAGCVHKHEIKQLTLRLDHHEMYSCYANHGCVLNEKRAMVDRHMLEQPQTTPRMLLFFASIFSVLCREFPLPGNRITPFTREQVIDALPPSKKRLAENGYKMLDRRYWGSWLTRVAAFVKYESAELDIKDPPELKAPRLIQHRHPGYCYTLAQYLKPLEHYLFSRRFGHRVRRPWITKGMDSWQVGKRLSQMDRWNDTVFIELDHSRFDSSLRLELRDIEFKFYERFFKGDEWFRTLIRAQRHNIGRTRNDIRYTVAGTMMSGEYNTSLGDSILNYGALRYWAGPEADIIVNGDDSVVAVPRRVFERLDFNWFQEIGFKTKYDIRYSLHDVTYCQCKPVRIDGRWRMVRNPWRVMSRAAHTCKSYPNSELYAELCHAKGLGELCCNTGVPILQEFALRMIACNPRFSKKAFDRYMLENRRREVFTTRAQPVTAQARLDFELAFGVTAAQQLSLERALQVAPLGCLL